MKKLLITGIVLSSISAFAGFERVTYSVKDIGLNRTSTPMGAFSEVSVEGVERSKIVGGPELPVQSYLLEGTPEQIEVNLNIRSKQVLRNLKPAPVQRQACRCDTNERKGFDYDESKYVQRSAPYSLNYLGDFRGQHITRLDVNLAKYNANDNSTEFYNDVEIMHNTQSFAMRESDFKDYLILVPQSLEKGVKEFSDWKISQGYKVTVKALTTPELSKEGIKKYIAEQFKTNGTDFVIIVGTEQSVPMWGLDTSSDPETPSDLTYFTMDGDTDHVPDVFGSRIVATSVDEVTAELAKSIEYEKASFKDNTGLTRMVGIASSEGANPSDKDYITAIEDTYKKTWLYQSTFLYQKDKKSNPTSLSTELNKGLHWIYYVGHGSGTSWPSMYQSYSTSDITKLKNADVVKPIVIDVACMNGKLVNSYFGTTFMDVNAKTGAFGAVAYYGGTVNVSWHPPALMARGIALEHTKKNFKHLGEALLAGQLYLTANWNSQEDVIDNFEWYHLQGDPGLRIDKK